MSDDNEADRPQEGVTVCPDLTGYPAALVTAAPATSEPENDDEPDGGTDDQPDRTDAGEGD